MSEFHKHNVELKKSDTYAIYMNFKNRQNHTVIQITCVASGYLKSKQAGVLLKEGTKRHCDIPTKTRVGLLLNKSEK